MRRSSIPCPMTSWSAGADETAAQAGLCGPCCTEILLIVCWRPRPVRRGGDPGVSLWHQRVPTTQWGLQDGRVPRPPGEEIGGSQCVRSPFAGPGSAGPGDRLRFSKIRTWD
jgi:hypothetical protein